MTKENKTMSKPKKEYLSKIQQDQEAIGAKLKAIRIANGIELKDIAFRDVAEHIERGIFVYPARQAITAHYLVQYCHEIGASLGPYNCQNESDGDSLEKTTEAKEVCVICGGEATIIDTVFLRHFCQKCSEDLNFNN